MFYDSNKKAKLTESQLFRCYGLKPTDDLVNVGSGIFSLNEPVPEGFDEEVHNIIVSGFTINKQTASATKDSRIEFKERAVVESVIAARLGEKRYKLETAGITWREHPVHTDREARFLIAVEMKAIEDGFRKDGKEWKFKDGFHSVSNADYPLLSAAVYKYSSGCFDREAEICKLVAEAEDTAGAYQVYLDEKDTGWPEDTDNVD